MFVERQFNKSIHKRIIHEFKPVEILGWMGLINFKSFDMLDKFKTKAKDREHVLELQLNYQGLRGY